MQNLSLPCLDYKRGLVGSSLSANRDIFKSRLEYVAKPFITVQNNWVEGRVEASRRVSGGVVETETRELKTYGILGWRATMNRSGDRFSTPGQIGQTLLDRWKSLLHPSRRVDQRSWQNRFEGFQGNRKHGPNLERRKGKGGHSKVSLSLLIHNSEA